MSASGELEVRLEAACEAELDVQWSYVGNKSNQRGLWYAVDYATNTVPAYVSGKRKDVVFKELKALLAPFAITSYLCPAGTTRITGVHMSAIWKRTNIKPASATPRK